ncbi:hypothetical protein BsWGS_06627 [Bradybaena similaris]
MMLFCVLLLACVQVSASTFLLHNRTKRQSSRSCETCSSLLQCAPKYQVFEGHTACRSRSPTAVPIEFTEDEKEKILAIHNKLRASVTPFAGDMLLMKWDPEVEMNARHWAEACVRTATGGFTHDSLRFIPGRFSLGQNIGWGQPNITKAIDEWFAEKANYDPRFGEMLNGLPDDKNFGHYTQIVWARTSQLGCAASICDKTKFWVCEYGRGGNVLPFSSPYTKANTRGELCKKKTAEGLCDCGDLICENNSKMNVSECTCKCGMLNSVLEQPDCRINCSKPAGKYCGTQKSYMPTNCNNAYTVSGCPHMCGICPCVEKSYANAKCSSRSDLIDSSRVERIFTWMSAVFVLALAL